MKQLARLVLGLLVLGFVTGHLQDAEGSSFSSEHTHTPITHIVAGVASVVLSFAILGWNERRAVRAARVLAEGRSQVREVASNVVQAENANKLVHVTGRCSAAEAPQDRTFGVCAQEAIRLRRVVEVYQWTEKKTSVTEKGDIDGRKETTTVYSYEKKWSRELINSENFKVARDKHHNPESFLFDTLVFSGEGIRVGEFLLSESLVDKLSAFVAYQHLSLDSIPDDDIRETCQVTPDHCFYFGRLPQSPSIGDVRVFFEIVEPCEVSVVAQQVGNLLQPYPTRHSGSIALLAVGEHSSTSMFTEAGKTSVLLTWLLRVIGWLLAVIGLDLLGEPLTAFFADLAVIGPFLSCTSTLVVWMFASVLALLVILLSWLRFRPLVSLTLFLIGSFALLLSWSLHSSSLVQSD